MRYTIAVLPGDGIGPEIMQEGIKVLEAIATKHSHSFELRYANLGVVAFEKEGNPFPQTTVEICDSADVILKGTVGDQRFNKLAVELRPEEGLHKLRSRYDTFANLRPVKIYKTLIDASPLKNELIENGIEFMIVRELTGGLYFGKKVESTMNSEERYASDLMEYNESKIKRIARFAFEEARKKNQPLFNIHKSNVLASSRLWNLVVEELYQQEYSDVVLNHQLVDSMAYLMVKNIKKFNNSIVLLENMMGDLISDEAGGIIGSLGLMPSASIGPKKAYYEPSHGSAPDIAGKNIANPYSMIGCVALMLEKSLKLDKEAKEIWGALERVFDEGYRTIEIANKKTQNEKILLTSQFGDEVVKHLGE